MIAIVCWKNEAVEFEIELVYWIGATKTRGLKMSYIDISDAEYVTCQMNARARRSLSTAWEDVERPIQLKYVGCISALIRA